MKNMIGRALWFPSKASVEVRNEELPAINNSKILLESTYSAISRGTERLVYQGQVPKNLYSIMSVPYQRGSFSFPIKYGYSLVGSIIEASNDDLIGRNVHLLHPHQDKTVVKLNDVQLLPSDIKIEDAPHLSNLETAVNAIWDAEIDLGDSIIIIGFGTIGSLIGRVLKSYKMSEISVYDIDPQKLSYAKKLGLNVIQTDEVVELGGSCDISIHCSGTQLGLQTAIDVIGFESRCVDVSWYGTGKVSLSLGESFHPLRKTIVSSQVSNIPSRKQPRWSYQRRRDLVLKMLERNIMKNSKNHIVEFENITAEYPNLISANGDNYQTLIRY